MWDPLRHRRRSGGALAVAVWLAAVAYPATARAATPSTPPTPAAPSPPPALAGTTAPVRSTAGLADFIDPAFINTGGPPTPPVRGVALTGGRFPDKGVIAYGDAASPPRPAAVTLSAPVVGMAPTPDGRGYWLAGADGEVVAVGDAAPHGSASPASLTAPIVAMAANPEGGGYWLAGLDGRVLGFGNAAALGGRAIAADQAPVVAITATPDGRGYWLTSADGGVSAFGDARSFGSMAGHRLYAPVVGLAATADGRGYWEVASDGGVFSFGDARYDGSMGGRPVDASIMGIAATADGKGYWLGADDGSVFSFGDARYYGANAAAVPTPAIAGIVATHDGRGYWLLDPATIPTTFGATAATLGAAVVRGAASQLGGNPMGGYFCNRYGPCEEWCALFATWTWQHAGVAIPTYAFTGDVYRWAARHTHVMGAAARPAPGDAVLYGTGPTSTTTSLHVGIVAQVWPDGAIVTIEGDGGPGPPGSANVVINGPYLPSDSATYNGFAVYGYAVP